MFKTIISPEALANIISTASVHYIYIMNQIRHLLMWFHKYTSLQEIPIAKYPEEFHVFLNFDNVYHGDSINSLRIGHDIFVIFLVKVYVLPSKSLRRIL